MDYVPPLGSGSWEVGNGREAGLIIVGKGTKDNGGKGKNWERRCEGM